MFWTEGAPKVLLRFEWDSGPIGPGLSDWGPLAFHEIGPKDWYRVYFDCHRRACHGLSATLVCLYHWWILFGHLHTGIGGWLLGGRLTAFQKARDSVRCLHGAWSPSAEVLCVISTFYFEQFLSQQTQRSYRYLCCCLDVAPHICHGIARARVMQGACFFSKILSEGSNFQFRIHDN